MNVALVIVIVVDVTYERERERGARKGTRRGESFTA